MPKISKKEKTKEPTVEEQIAQIQEHYGQYNRHVRRMWGKLVGFNKLIKGTSIPFKKDEYEAIEVPTIPYVCKTEGCINNRRDGSAFCQECSNKFHENK